ncbi:serine/threonine-protein kinase [Streptomyces sp. NPDC126499]|uniref:serine/threonine-protein kinase n=1 Tax=Streptomyces sp. NPDC126499 TaxID=3155314 RepID=UPI00331C1D5C
MGEVFAGRYELIDPIGRGGVGAVWRAWDHRRRRYVAAKVLQQSDAHTLLRFVREQALRIDHPHVLAPASWAADDDKVLFTMDLVAGGSLAHVIGDYGALPPRFVCTLLDQLLSGLAAVHAEGVVHRDIKPANILLEVTGTGRPHLRLSDFGISMRKGEPRLTETNYVVGTPGYFAPEQLMGAEPDFTADLFAVGLVGLYLLQGRRPDSQALVDHFMTYGTPSAPRGISEPLWQVLAGLLQPDPQARFKTATGARKALNAAAELLPEPGPGEERVEILDQIGPLPAGFGPNGPEPVPAEQPQHAQQPAQQDASQHQPNLPSPSETGSFHLPPPPRTPTRPVAVPPAPAFGPPPPQVAPQPGASRPGASPAMSPAAQAGAPAPSSVQPSAHSPASFAQAPTAAVSNEQVSTRSYTAQAGSVPVRRPGPPAKVAVPVLVTALVCFAVGIWALIQA